MRPLEENVLQHAVLTVAGGVAIKYPRGKVVTWLRGGAAQGSLEFVGSGFSQRVVLDLSKSPLPPANVGNILPRVQKVTTQISDVIVLGGP